MTPTAVVFENSTPTFRQLSPFFCSHMPRIATSKWVTLAELFEIAPSSSNTFVSLYALVNQISGVKITKGSDKSQTIHLWDPSLAQSQHDFISLMIFLPDESFFPPATHGGSGPRDVIRLKNVKLNLHDGKPQLILHRQQSEMALLAGGHQQNTLKPKWTFHEQQLNEKFDVDQQRVHYLRQSDRHSLPQSTPFEINPVPRGSASPFSFTSSSSSSSSTFSAFSSSALSAAASSFVAPDDHPSDGLMDDLFSSSCAIAAASSLSSSSSSSSLFGFSRLSSHSPPRTSCLSPMPVPLSPSLPSSSSSASPAASSLSLLPLQSLPSFSATAPSSSRMMQLFADPGTKKRTAQQAGLASSSSSSAAAAAASSSSSSSLSTTTISSALSSSLASASASSSTLSFSLVAPSSAFSSSTSPLPPLPALSSAFHENDLEAEFWASHSSASSSSSPSLELFAQQKKPKTTAAKAPQSKKLGNKYLQSLSTSQKLSTLDLAVKVMAVCFHYNSVPPEDFPFIAEIPTSSASLRTSSSSSSSSSSLAPSSLSSCADSSSTSPSSSSPPTPCHSSSVSLPTLAQLCVPDYVFSSPHTSLELVLWDGTTAAKPFATQSSWSSQFLSAGSQKALSQQALQKALYWPSFGSFASIMCSPHVMINIRHQIRLGGWIHVRNVKSTNSNANGDIYMTFQAHSSMRSLPDDDEVVLHRIENIDVESLEHHKRQANAAAIPTDKASSSSLSLSSSSLPLSSSLLKPTLISACKYPEHPISFIKSILSCKQKVDRFRIQARVVSIIPKVIDEYTRIFCTRCRVSLDMEVDSRECPGCKTPASSLDWIYSMALILRDASGELKTIVTGEPAIAFFQGMRPCDLRVNNVSREAIQARTHWMLNQNHCLDACVVMYHESNGDRRFQLCDTRLLYSS